MPHIHIVGAGLAGLSCAVTLVRAGRGADVTIHEGAPQAGGRCRSFYDPHLDRRIDNGNHLLLSANRAALAYLETIGARDTLTQPSAAAFPFFDAATGERWVFRPNRGPLPLWVFSADRRAPGTRPADYLPLAGLLRARPDATVADAIRLRREAAVFKRLLEPLVLAVMNTSPDRAAAAPMRRVLLETFGKGEAAMRPLVARAGLADSLIDPAQTWLAAKGVTIRLRERIRALTLGQGHVTALHTGQETIELAKTDSVVLAVPPGPAATLLPGLLVPEDGLPIVNAHFRLTERPTLITPDLPFLGLIGTVGHWLFVRGDIVSVTVSGAVDLIEQPADHLLQQLWGEVVQALALPASALPPSRLIREKRATFVQSPANQARRPAAATARHNLWLAGDWTDTGLPATIEGAIRSGTRAAEHVLSRPRA